MKKPQAESEKVQPLYDERQIQARGEAHKYGFWAGILYFIAVHVALDSGILPTSVEQAILIGLLVMFWVFAAVAIWKDAYFRFGNQLGIMNAMYLGAGILMLIYCWGKSTFGVCLALALIALIVLSIIRIILNREENDA